MDKWIKDVEKYNSKVGNVKAGLSQHLVSKRLEVFSMLRTFLSKSNHQAVKTDVILDDLLQFLSSSVSYLRTKKTFGPDILDIMRCQILSSKELINMIRVDLEFNQWKTLLDIGFDLLKSGNISTSSLDFNYKVIYFGSQFSNVWCNIRSHFNLFEQLFQNEDLVRKSATTETKIAALKLLNVVQETLKREARILLCQFGQNLGLNILAMIVPERTDDLVIEFFNLQMRLHYPLGIANSSENSLNNLLPRLFDQLIVSTIQHSQRYNRHRRDYSYEIKDTLLDLALRIAKQVRALYEQRSVNLDNCFASHSVTTLTSGKKRTSVLYEAIFLVTRTGTRTGTRTTLFDERLMLWVSNNSNVGPKIVFSVTIIRVFC